MKPERASWRVMRRPFAGVDEVESRLGLGAAVHVGLCEHEVKVGAHCIGEGKGCEAPDVRLGVVQFRGVGWSRYECVIVKGGVGTDVGIEDVVGALRDHP